VKPALGLVLVLVLYALVGAAFAFNLGGFSDRAADHYRGKPWLVRQIGRDNPNAWRGGGLIMLTFGVAMIIGLLVLAAWHPPTISLTVAILVLGIAAIASALMLFRPRWRQRGKSVHQPPAPPDGRYEE
jgi:hypothetical protein